jgi:hypothetical protein
VLVGDTLAARAERQDRPGLMKSAGLKGGQNVRSARNRMRQARSSVIWLLSIAAAWTATAWLGRHPEPWAIELTNPVFAAALAWTYIGSWGIAIACARRPRVVLFRATAMTLSLLLGLLVLEAPAVAGAIDYSRIRSALTGDWNGPSTDFINDREFSFRRPPNQHWSGRLQSSMAQYFNLPIRSAYRQTFSTDSRGFRNLTALDRADIVLIGDSYIEGAYVSDEETVAVRLHELTNRGVANLGVSGYGTLQQLRVLEKYALSLEPRLVAWFFFEGNDLDDDQEFENAMAYEQGVPAPTAPTPRSVRWREFLKRSFTMNAFVQARAMSDRLVPNGIDSFGWFRDRGGASHRFYFFDFYATRTFGDYERERFETTKATFRQGAEIARQHGIRLVIFYIPIKFRVYGDLCTFPAGSPCPRWRPWDLEARFAAFCLDAGIPFVSLTEPMHRAAAAGEVLYAPEDSHWNAAGHAFVAREVATYWTSAPMAK